MILNQMEGMHISENSIARLSPFAVEASWATGKWTTLEKYLQRKPEPPNSDFNISVGRALLALHHKDYDKFSSLIDELRDNVCGGLSASTTANFQAAHDVILKLHILAEVDILSGVCSKQAPDRESLSKLMDR